MTGNRARSVVLYGLAGVLLIAGVLWFVRTAPRTGEDPAVTAGRKTAERLLPDLPLQSEAETMVLAAGVRTERTTSVRGGSYTLALLCIGAGQIRVRLSAQGVDSGRAVPCDEGEPVPLELTVGLADEFFMAVSAETDGPSVFRWRVIRARDY
ncbi:DUF6023 family protein [Actinoplanes sp. NPDC026623]|uniref:DUF6023 family protein n=1 Tax=Actinoplanes sp. NPDC026623 TaxID=3155610 RepID=UPI0033F2589E